MAKNNRFPSNANKQKKQAEKKPAAPEAVKAVEGKKVELVEVEYKKENHHVLDHVHALRKGKNHLPKEVWEKAKAHPVNAALIKEGHLVGPAEDMIDEEESAAEGEGADESAESEEGSEE